MNVETQPRTLDASGSDGDLMTNDSTDPALGRPPQLTEPATSELDQGRLQAVQSLLLQEGLGLFVGLGLLAAGAVVLTVAWARISELADVPRQIPLLISGGLTGIGLVIVGITVIAIDVATRQSAARCRRADALADAIHHIESLLGSAR